MLATRLTLTLARGMFFVFATFGLLLGGGVILVAGMVGVCAAAAVFLYGVDIYSRICSAFRSGGDS